MKLQRLSLLTVLFTALLLSNLPATAQPPGGRSPGGRGREGARPGDSGGGRRGPGMGPGGQQTPPFVRIFDADGDGELSAKEIDNAANALRKLDKNRDGKLTSGELRPSAPGGQGRGPGGMQGGRPGGGRPGGERPGGGRPGGGGGGRGGDPAQADAAFAESLMEFDSNKDGVLSQDELPGHMHDAFAKSDINKDGSLNKEERLGLASHFRRNKLNPEGGEPVNAPTQGQRPGAGGQRPGAGGQRPGGQRPGGGGAQSARTRPRDRVRPRDSEFNDKFPVGSELPADLKVYSADRKLAPVKSLLKAKYTVIVGGCLTCPEFRNSYPEIEAVARDFAGKDVDFYFVYQALTHPENWGYVQPSSIEDRFAQVEHAKELLKTRISWLTDPMDNQMKSHFVITPNSQFLYDKSGKIVHRSSWARGSSLRETLEKLVGKPATYTTVEALKLPRFERHLTPQSEMLVERVRVEGVAVPLRVASGGKSNLVSALRSTDFSEDNRYVKLRPEADQQLINTGTGKLYLGFRQDPVLGAKWNNLATPPKYKITAKSAAFSPATGESPKLKVDSDKEPREFLVDVKNWKAGEPISVEIQYFACNNEKGWCKPVQQEFTVWLDKDGLAGMVNGRSHFPGGRGGGRQGAGGRGRPGEGQRPGGQRPGGQRPGQRD